MRGDEGLAGMQVEVQGLSRQGQVQKDVQTIEPAAVAEEAVVEALCVAEGRILTLKFDGRLGPWAGAARACGCWEFLGGQVCGTSRAQVQEGVQKTIVFGAEDKEAWHVAAGETSQAPTMCDTEPRGSLSEKCEEKQNGRSETCIDLQAEVWDEYIVCSLSRFLRHFDASGLGVPANPEPRSPTCSRVFGHFGFCLGVPQPSQCPVPGASELVLQNRCWSNGGDMGRA